MTGVNVRDVRRQASGALLRGAVYSLSFVVYRPSSVVHRLRIGMSDLIGKTLGHYEILERIGQGGMAEVYKGYQRLLDRYVAVKVLHAFMLTEVGSQERFQREARAVAALRHPNIVQVFDFDVANNIYFMIMEFIDG